MTEEDKPEDQNLPASDRTVAAPESSAPTETIEPEVKTERVTETDVSFDDGAPADVTASSEDKTEESARFFTDGALPEDVDADTEATEESKLQRQSLSGGGADTPSGSDFYTQSIKELLSRVERSELPLQEILQDFQRPIRAIASVDIRLVLYALRAAVGNNLGYADITRRADGSRRRRAAVVEVRLSDVCAALAQRHDAIVINVGDYGLSIFDMKDFLVGDWSDGVAESVPVYLVGEDWTEEVQTEFGGRLDFSWLPDTEMVRFVFKAHKPEEKSHFDPDIVPVENWREFIDALFSDPAYASQLYEHHVANAASADLPPELDELLQRVEGGREPSIAACLYLLAEFPSLPLVSFETLHEGLAATLVAQSSTSDENDKSLRSKLISEDLSLCRARYERPPDAKQRIALFGGRWRAAVKTALGSRLAVLRRESELYVLANASMLLQDSVARTSLANLLAKRLVDDGSLGSVEGAKLLAALLTAAGKEATAESLDFLRAFAVALTDGGATKADDTEKGAGAKIVGLLAGTELSSAWPLIWAYALFGPAADLTSALREALSRATIDRLDALGEISDTVVQTTPRYDILVETAAGYFLETPETERVLGADRLLGDLLLEDWITQDDDDDAAYILKGHIDAETKTRLRLQMADLVAFDHKWAPSGTAVLSSLFKHRFEVAYSLLFGQERERYMRHYFLRHQLRLVHPSDFDAEDSALFNRSPMQPANKGRFDRHLDALCQTPQLIALALLHEKKSDAELEPDPKVIERLSERVGDQRIYRRVRDTLSLISDDLLWAGGYAMRRPLEDRQAQRLQRLLIGNNRRIFRALGKVLRNPTAL
ncbi:MAG: hypothetical protein AAGA72_05275 [Pseudomonadota bacterium]